MQAQLLEDVDHLFLEHGLGEWLDDVAGGTELRWVMFGRSTFVTKLMGVFVSMDTMIGKDFEKGLSQLKAAAER